MTWSHDVTEGSMLELYHSGLTTCSKQVRHCLREKGVSHESRYVELWRYENLSPAYLKLNPNGVVPTLVHDGTPIINSFCINEYIDDAFPDPPLRPADLKDRARMRYWAWTADEIHLSLARLTHAHMLQPGVDGLREEDREIMLAATPVPEKRERWRVLTIRPSSCRSLSVTCFSSSGGWRKSWRRAGPGWPGRLSRSATSPWQRSCTASSSSIPTGSTVRSFPG
jgi:Glutathione S-transferase, N-terminal domain